MFSYLRAILNWRLRFSEPDRDFELLLSWVLLAGIIGSLFVLREPLFSRLQDDYLWAAGIYFFAGVFDYWHGTKKGTKGLKVLGIGAIVASIAFLDVAVSSGGPNKLRTGLMLISSIMLIIWSIIVQWSSIKTEKTKKDINT